MLRCFPSGVLRHRLDAFVHVPDGWPAHGVISFREVSLRYAAHLPPVITNLSFTIGSGEKVGIVGRTGAGKTTITAALFRLIDPCGGDIIIDGVITTRIDLHTLRSRLSVVPQDPVMFEGTLRSNLDPFGSYTDEQLWDALHQVHLGHMVRGLAGRLGAIVTDGGDNFSLGQRQLVCIARAILKGASILVLDEATSAVDTETDALVQRTIREAFAHATVLTIAHRLNTIIDSDRIMVMEKGHLAEFASPAELCQRPHGLFNALVEATGEANASYLRAAARGEVDVLEMFQYPS